MLTFDQSELSLKTPFRLIVAGPSGSGKTFFAANLISQRHVMFDHPPETILLVYKHWQSIYDKLEEEEGVTFTEEVPDPLPQNGLVILDDIMLEAGERTVTIFTRESHHRNCSVIYLAQSLFGNKTQRLLSINATYMALMKSVRDRLSITTLARQMFPGRGAYLLNAYKAATAQPYSYLLLDLHQESRDQIRVRSHIFPDESPVHLFVPSK